MLSEDILNHGTWPLRDLILSSMTVVYDHISVIVQMGYLRLLTVKNASFPSSMLENCTIVAFPLTVSPNAMRQVGRGKNVE